MENDKSEASCLALIVYRIVYGSIIFEMRVKPADDEMICSRSQLERTAHLYAQFLPFAVWAARSEELLCHAETTRDTVDDYG